MYTRSNLIRKTAVFLLRNILLYFLLYNSYLQLKELVSIIFLSLTFLLAILLALWLEKSRLKFIFSLLIIICVPILLRLLFFQFFNLQRLLNPSPGADLQYTLFDIEFFPALLPFYIVWLLNFLALRHSVFIYFEAVINLLLFILVFHTQAENNITIYPNPLFFAIALALFFLLQVLILILGRYPNWKVQIENKYYLRALFSMVLIAIPVFILFFLLLRQYNEESIKAGGGLMKNNLFQFDFSQYIKLESQIKLSDDLVLLMRKDGKTEKFLLRRFILSGYENSKGFFMVQDEKLKEQPGIVPDSTLILPDPQYQGRININQEYYFVNFAPESLVALNYPVRVMPLTNWNASSFQRIYKVDSQALRSIPYEIEDMTQPTMDKEIYTHYTNYGEDEKIQALAEQVIQYADTYFFKVLTVMRYLQENYYYSLNPGIAPEGNQLHHFLFETKRGYCSYSAFAMCLMLRSLGIPARVAVGFLVGPENEVLNFYRAKEILNFYEIRAYQAHAWVEVFFGSYGWLEFDPTALELAPGEEFPFTFGAGDSQNIMSLIEEILNNQHILSEIVKKDDDHDLDEAQSLDKYLVEGLRFMLNISYILLPLFYLFILLAIKYYYYLLFLLNKPVRKKTKLLYAFSLMFPYARGWIRKREESLLEYANRLQNTKKLMLVNWTKYYLKAVFAKDFSLQSYTLALKYYNKFTASYRRNVHIGMRILTLLNPINCLKKRV